MPFLIPSFNAIRTQIQQDFANGQLSLLPKSVLGIVATAQAAMSYLHFQYLSAIARDAVPFTCATPFLDAWAALKGVYRKSPTPATGFVAFTGLAATIVSANTVVNRSDGFTYTTGENFVIGTTTSTNAVATVAGQAGNCPVIGTSMMLANSIVGVNANVALMTAFTSGADEELDASLRSRMLAVYASPPSGGSITDYTEWANAVPGVTRSWADGSGGGAGTVVVYPMFDETEATSNAATSGFPVGTNGTASAETRGTGAATGDQLSVANYIYPLRPATALVYVIAPLPYSINVQTLGLSVNATIIAEISTSLSSLYLAIGSALGTSLAPSQITGAINSVVPTQAFTLVSPATPISIPLGSLPVMGNAVLN